MEQAAIAALVMVVAIVIMLALGFPIGLSSTDPARLMTWASVLSTAVSLECSCVATNNRGCARCGT